MNTNLKGRKILKAAGIIAVFVGMIAAFVGFFVMYTSMTMTNVDAENAVQQSSGYGDVIGMYIIVYGIFACVAGFIGAINADSSDYAKKCFNYGLIFVGLSVINVIIMAVTANIFATLSLIITGVPLLISILYMFGAFLNVKSVCK